MHKLASLRKTYSELVFSLASVNTSFEADKKDAMTLAESLKALQATGEAEKITQCKIDLEAVNARFLDRQREHSELSDKKQIVEASIFNVYKTAFETGQGLDYVVFLEDGDLYDDWSQRFKKGKIALINIEVCSFELSVIKLLCKFSKLRLVVAGDRYRLKGEYSVYRDTCWADYDGSFILERMSPFFVDKTELDVTDDFLKSLAVLR